MTASLLVLDITKWAFAKTIKESMHVERVNLKIYK